MTVFQLRTGFTLNTERHGFRYYLYYSYYLSY